MRTITITVNGDADVQLDGVALPSEAAPVTAAVASTADQTDDTIRHDTPPEVAIAVTAHEANRAYQRVVGEAVNPLWADLPGEIRAGMIEAVRALQLATQQGRVVTPEESHDRWLATRKDEGWVYGPEKSYVAKTHPLMVPFSDLAPEQRKKDRLFLAIATALLAPE